MTDSYKQFLQKLPMVEPARQLGFLITKKITQRALRTARVRALVFSMITVGLFIGMVSIVRLVGGEIVNSEWWQYLTLLFDRQTVLAAGQDLVWLLVESAPVWGITILLIGAWLLLLSLRTTITNLKSLNFKQRLIS